MADLGSDVGPSVASDQVAVADHDHDHDHVCDHGIVGATARGVLARPSPKQRWRLLADLEQRHCLAT